MRQRGRWAVVGAVLAAGWLASPAAVPLYDGVGFPDEPYRFVPPHSAAAPGATTARVVLKVARGVNAGGLIANTAEAGPQVSFYAPPQAFALPSPTAATDIVLTVTPVPMAAPAPRGQLDSNVYAVAFTSDAGAVQVRPEAQSPTISLRAVTAAQPLPVVQYRPAAAQPWRELRTRQVGRDIVTADAPGAGEYVLTRPLAVGARSGGSRTGLLVVLGAVVLLVAAVLVGVRLLARQQE